MERLPWTEGLHVTERWYGPVAMSITGRPLVGKLANENLYVCGCYNGVGMVDGFYHASLLAHQILGANHTDLEYLVGPEKARWIPPEPFRSIAAKTIFAIGL